MNCKWPMIRLKYLGRGPLKYGANEAALGDDPDFPRFIRITDLNEDGTLRNDSFKSLETKLAAPYLLKDGDLLFARSGATVGKAFFYTVAVGNACFAGYLVRFRPDSRKIEPRFVWYVTQSGIFREQVNAATIQATIQNVSAERYGNFLFPVPNISEQREIIDFLDRETAKIDALTDSYRRLLSCLSEELTSLVLSSASSDRSRKMRLRDAAQIILRPAIQRENEQYTPIGLYNRGRGLFHKDQREMEDMGDSDFFWIETGDLIISGQFAWEGAIALAGTEDSGCVVSHRYHVLRGIPGVALTEYLLALLSTELGDFLLNENSRGAAGRNRPLNINSLLKEEVSVHDLQTQQDIASLVHSRARVQKETEKQDRLLKEYRSALVSAAVTGHIDVRNYRPQEAAALCQ